MCQRCVKGRCTFEQSRLVNLGFIMSTFTRHCEAIQLKAFLLAIRRLKKDMTQRLLKQPLTYPWQCSSKTIMNTKFVARKWMTLMSLVLFCVGMILSKYGTLHCRVFVLHKARSQTDAGPPIIFGRQDGHSNENMQLWNYYIHPNNRPEWRVTPCQSPKIIISVLEEFQFLFIQTLLHFAALWPSAAVDGHTLQICIYQQQKKTLWPRLHLSSVDNLTTINSYLKTACPSQNSYSQYAPTSIQHMLSTVFFSLNWISAEASELHLCILGMDDKECTTEPDETPYWTLFISEVKVCHVRLKPGNNNAKYRFLTETCSSCDWEILSSNPGDGRDIDGREPREKIACAPWVNGRGGITLSLLLITQTLAKCSQSVRLSMWKRVDST